MQLFNISIPLHRFLGHNFLWKRENQRQKLMKTKRQFLETRRQGWKEIARQTGRNVDIGSVNGILKEKDEHRKTERVIDIQGIQIGKQRDGLNN